MNARRWGLSLVVALSLTAVVVAVGAWRARLPRQTDDAAPSAAAPHRIASLTLAGDEILSALVPADRVVCVTHLADDPEISNVPDVYPRSIPRVRAAETERIVAMSPDLVCVASYNSADSLELLRRSGLPVYQHNDCQSIDEIEANILDFGTRIGEAARAAKIVGSMRERRQRLAEKLRQITNRPRVLFWSAGFTSGTKTPMDDIIREAGGVNVGAERGLEGTVEISPEQVIAANPTFVLQSCWSADEHERSIDHHPLLRNLEAVRENRVITIEGKYLSALSQYVIEGAERLARQLHADRFPDDRPATPANER
ncbi:MAG TPA: ABC transporter substrate-binding protein [Pirellulales bacterium]|nr:ABC transporter substrate-binding protein [Pirellulales bacterium]